MKTNLFFVLALLIGLTLSIPSSLLSSENKKAEEVKPVQVPETKPTEVVESKENKKEEVKTTSSNNAQSTTNNENDNTQKADHIRSGSDVFAGFEKRAEHLLSSIIPISTKKPDNTKTEKSKTSLIQSFSSISGKEFREMALGLIFD
eukprot:c20240_g2_i1.p1 GENE.c20240_g2_i1~~c20240_g2_i1.p1  ORF type:complete len:147 (+),score=62.91 c20240_g2_i1:41-481(+)